jgi:hypothetical protein
MAFSLLVPVYDWRTAFLRESVDTSTAATPTERDKRDEEGKKKTYRENTDRVDGQLINFGVGHDCGICSSR